ncbi:MAG: diversity-generating retroelement protein Avd [Desulfobacteraceae bacterium]|nr:diversity-generating retroelement protein Avd [Desulfobacteraceae bacterium]
MSMEPPLFVLWYDFLKWLLLKTEKFPQKVRFVFSNRIENLAVDIAEWLVEARFSKNKRESLRKIDMGMERLRILLRLCHDMAYLDHKGYEFASRKINEAGKMVGGWRKQQEGLRR